MNLLSLGLVNWKKRLHKKEPFDLGLAVVGGRHEMETAAAVVEDENAAASIGEGAIVEDTVQKE